MVNVVSSNGGSYLNVLGSDFALDADGNERGNGLITGQNLVYFKGCTLLHAVGLAAWLAPSCPVDLSYDVVVVSPSGERLERMLNEVEAGKVEVIIDKVFDLAKAAEAYDYLQRGHARGKVLIEIPPIHFKYNH